MNLKIVPLLVFIIMLAFSFRLAEVITGVSTLSGAAYAQQEVDVQPPDFVKNGHGESNGDDSEKPGSGIVFVDDEEEETDAAEHVTEEEDGEPVDWRDASDSDLDYTNVRMELFEDLSKRRKEIEEREQSVLAHEALLRAAEQELDRKYQELSQLRNELERLLDEQSEEEQTRIMSLVKIYEGMKPKDAARIFNTLDLDILVSVLSKMSERKLSPVLANMNPERARTVTIMLAEQKQLPSLPQSN